MELLFPLILLVLGYRFVQARVQGRRIRLLGGYLERYRIERLMQTLLDGYLRALGEQDPERQRAIWSTLQAAETDMRDQVKRLAEDFDNVFGDQTLVSTLSVSFPYASTLFPRATFDMRKALALHARGIESVVDNQAQRSERDKAFMLSAELLLLQHTCHWFCRSQAVASARLLRSHQTAHAQVLAAVSPETRAAYERLTAR